MKIFIKEISGDDGLEFEQMVTAKDLDLPEDIFQCLGLLEVYGDFQNVGDEVLVNFEVSGKYRLSCGRCLEDFEIEKIDQFEYIFDIDPRTESIDFTEAVREEMILAMASSPVCREDCKGLCLGCGIDLNKGKCNCKRES